MNSAVPSISDIVRVSVEEHRDAVGALMPILHSVQHRLGCIPKEAIPEIARLLNLSRAEVQGVMDFYHDFRTTPPGRHTVHICRAEACQAMGARELERHAKTSLGVDWGGTTADGLITLEPVYCLGNCACSPSVRVDDDFHARVDPEYFDEMVSKLREVES